MCDFVRGVVKGIFVFLVVFVWLMESLGSNCGVGLISFFLAVVLMGLFLRLGYSWELGG